MNIDELQEKNTELQNAYDALKRVHDATNNAVKQFQDENDRLRKENNILVMEKRQFEESRTLQEQIIQQTLDRNNAQMNRYLEDNHELKDSVRYYKREIKELREEIKNLKKGS